MNSWAAFRTQHVRVFGADCYVHKHDRNKLGDAARGVFVGLSPSAVVFHPDLRTVTRRSIMCVEG